MATVTLGSKAEGSIIKLKENGVLVDFYIAKQNYESGLNGSGRVLVVRKDCYDQRQWHGSNVNAYASSTIDAWLNSTYKNLLDANIRTAMGTTKIHYTPGNNNWNVTTLERSVFLLSATELGQSHTYMKAEGTALSSTVVNLLKIAKLNGSAYPQWTRSPHTTAPTTPGSWSPMATSTATAAPAPTGPAPLSLSPPPSMSAMTALCPSTPPPAPPPVSAIPPASTAARTSP